MLRLTRAGRAEPKVDPQQTGLTETTGPLRKVSKDSGPEPLSPEAMVSSPDGTAELLAEASTTAAAQNQTIFNDQVHSQNLTIHNGISPVEYIADQTRLQTQLQSLRNDLNSLVCYVHMQFRRSAHTYGQISTQDHLEQGCTHNHGVGPWAPSNFDPYEYGSDLNNNVQPENDCGGDDAGLGEKDYDADWYDQRPEEDQTWYQERAQTDIAGIDAWRGSFPAGTTPDPPSAPPSPSMRVPSLILSSSSPPPPLSIAYSAKAIAEPPIPPTVASTSGAGDIDGQGLGAEKDTRPPERNVVSCNGSVSSAQAERHSRKTAPSSSACSYTGADAQDP